MAYIGIILIVILIIKSVIAGTIRKIISNIISLALLVATPFIFHAVYSAKGTPSTVMDELGSRVVQVPNIYFFVSALAVMILFSYGIFGFIRNNILPKKLAGISALIPTLLYLGTLTRGTELYVPDFKAFGLILAVSVFLVCGGINGIAGRKRFD